MIVLICLVWVAVGCCIALYGKQQILKYPEGCTAEQKEFDKWFIWVAFWPLCIIHLIIKKIFPPLA